MAETQAEKLIADHWAPRWLRPVSSRPRLVIGVVVGLLVGFLAPGHLKAATRGIIGWDAGAVCFLILVFIAWNQAEIRHICRRAALQDEGRNAVLVLALGGVIAAVAAIVSELGPAKADAGVDKALQSTLGMGTVAISWLFLQTFLAQHYAHEYYATTRSKDGKPQGGLAFPGDDDPGYWDFFHFAITIGAAAQTADIQITSKAMRMLVTWHALTAYAFNTVVLALAISLLAGLFG
jgi:uncharacterized membrane protein